MRGETPKEEVSEFDEKANVWKDLEDVTEIDMGKQELENIEEVKESTPGIVQRVEQVSFSGTRPVTLSVVLLPLMFKSCYRSL